MAFIRLFSYEQFHWLLVHIWQILMFFSITSTHISWTVRTFVSVPLKDQSRRWPVQCLPSTETYGCLPHHKVYEWHILQERLDSTRYWPNRRHCPHIQSLPVMDLLWKILKKVYKSFSGSTNRSGKILNSS